MVKGFRGTEERERVNFVAQPLITNPVNYNENVCILILQFRHDGFCRPADRFFK